MAQRVLVCGCGKEVKVKNYGLLFKKNKRNSITSFSPERYSCSKCRGIVAPPKIKHIEEDRVHLPPNYF